MAEEIRAGLTDEPKWIASKYFYDERGSKLFEQITALPEYYLTRAETRILERASDSIVTAAQPDELVELGSGFSRKTRLLLEAMQRLQVGYRYLPLDVSEEALLTASKSLARDYPWLEIVGVVGDFMSHLEDIPRDGTQLLCFLGSTVGNLDPDERAAFYRRVSARLEQRDRFLVGFDLVKDKRVLESAYNDSRGITAEFNRNILLVINREFAGNLPVDEFEHVARYVDERDRIEMWLRARRAIHARLDHLDLEVSLCAGEAIRTEISSKFTRDRAERELSAADLTIERWLTDEQCRFALATVAPGDRRQGE
ncbi:MAG: L-histidine N(alpha)-methyltransferase [Acidobacteriota bacterium]|nr:MAG: L-histidine N(alpha)-methyltransferase [Acidobacteriota bacterium]